MKHTTPPEAGDIIAAAERIAGVAHQTPVLVSRSFNKMLEACIFFKCENFQKSGSFKFRGALNAVKSLTDAERALGVATHSSGNHAQALALAASLNNVKAHLVMPENSSKPKVEAVKSYGGKISFCEPNLPSREETLKKVLKKTGAVPIHPYDDYRIIAGQATAAKELIETHDSLDYIIVPVGGGGLLSGTALSAAYFSSATKVIAAEPEQADDAFRSFYQKKWMPVVNPNTVADGLRTSLGKRNYPIIIKYVHDIVTVDESGILKAMRLLWERLKIIVEPSSAVAFAALLEKKVSFEKPHPKIGLIISGGNVDLDPFFMPKP